VRPVAFFATLFGKAFRMRYLRALQYVDAVARAGSIRKAAEDLALTASALNRRIMDLEAELGTPIFERLPKGVRLNAAGELLVRHARAQFAETERLRSQIADLSGMRRGHVAIACSAAAASNFVPDAIRRYREQFPAVTFDVLVRDHQSAQRALVDFAADLVLVFEPTVQPEMQPLVTLEQPLCAIMDPAHPLAAQPRLRLRDTLRYPLALPDRSYGGRQIVEEALGYRQWRVLPVLESNSFEVLREAVRGTDTITFQVAIGATAGLDGLVSRPMDPRDLRMGRLILGQLRGRTLPVAAAKFADQIARRLDALRETAG
jgi:DNA-binding transcriptional LysR family regulator